MSLDKQLNHLAGARYRALDQFYKSVRMREQAERDIAAIDAATAALAEVTAQPTTETPK
jgi:hypothetical protein